MALLLTHERNRTEDCPARLRRNRRGSRQMTPKDAKGQSQRPQPRHQSFFSVIWRVWRIVCSSSHTDRSSGYPRYPRLRKLRDASGIFADRSACRQYLKRPSRRRIFWEFVGLPGAWDFGISSRESRLNTGGSTLASLPIQKRVPPSLIFIAFCCIFLALLQQTQNFPQQHFVFQIDLIIKIGP
jgi:hypothetical protein